MTRVATYLVLALLLVVAQTIALAHAYQHEAGSPQQQICSSCVSASQLSSACIDSGETLEITASPAELIATAQTVPVSRHTLVTRQRGPPSLT